MEKLLKNSIYTILCATILLGTTQSNSMDKWSKFKTYFIKKSKIGTSNFLKEQKESLGLDDPYKRIYFKSCNIQKYCKLNKTTSYKGYYEFNKPPSYHQDEVKEYQNKVKEYQNNVKNCQKSAQYFQDDLKVNQDKVQEYQNKVKYNQNNVKNCQKSVKHNQELVKVCQDKLKVNQDKLQDELNNWKKLIKNHNYRIYYHNNKNYYLEILELNRDELQKTLEYNQYTLKYFQDRLQDILKYNQSTSKYLQDKLKTYQYNEESYKESVKDNQYDLERNQDKLKKIKKIINLLDIDFVSYDQRQYFGDDL